MTSLHKSFLALTFVVAAALAVVCAPASPASAAEEPKRPAEKITINFVDVDLSSMVRIMSDITGKNFIYDEGLKGKITIIAPTKLTSDEALKLFISALELKNYTLVPAGEAYKVIPLSLAKQSGTRVLGKGRGTRPVDSYIVRLVPIKYISTQDAFTLVQPYVSRFGQVSVFGARDALLVVDSAANVEKVLEIIASVDTPPDMVEPEIVYLEHSQAEVVAEILRNEARRAGMPTAAGNGAQATESVMADLRLNAVILSGPKYQRDYFKRFISLLDIPPPEKSSRINVYYLENADAEELGAVLSDLVKTGPRQRPGASGGPQGAASMVQELSGKVQVTPEKSSNALIIMASPADYNALVQVIEKLDRRPRQVFVEAMITEVTIDKALELGTKWRFTAEKGGEPVAIGGVGEIDASAIQTVINGLAGLSVGGLGNFLTVPVTAADGSTFNLTAPGFAALFSLNEFKDAVNVLSTPHILTSDNSEAEIVVGQNVPFLSSIERESSSTGQPLIQSIERKDVGIKLRIKPKISEGGFVKLDIYQEISAISPTTVTGASDLVTTKRSAQTTVVVKNDQTVVIGGLIQNRRTSNESRVPILSSIPILGRLFTFTSDRTEKTNVLVFITPHIIEKFEGLDDLKTRKIEEFAEEARGEDAAPVKEMREKAGE